MNNYFDTISDSTFITKESALKAAAEVKRAAKTPTIAVQCDECNKQFKEGDRFKCAECSNFDLCKDCFVTHEIELKAPQEEVGGHLTGGKHPFYIVRNFQDYVENFKL